MTTVINAQSIDTRVKTLLSQMTLDEKLAQLVSFWVYELMDGPDTSDEKMSRLFPKGIGQITRAAGASVLEPASVARTTNALQRYLVNETRLGIPAIVHEECCLGYLGLGGTMFPQMIGLASTWMPDLAEEMTVEIKKQLRAVGAHQGLSPVLDVARDPRWGRVEETFGEDPTLAAQFGVKYIRGLQGESLAEGGVMATGKHFIGHSISQGGQNCAPVHVGQRELWDIYMLPFQAAIRDANLHSIMNSYPELDGEVVAASRRILTDILRGKLGFSGLLVSDYEAVMMVNNYHRMAADYREAAMLSLKAGIDIELPTRVCYGEPLKDALDAGDLSVEFVDVSVERILNKKFELGLFENPYVDEKSVLEVFETPQQRHLAREIAQKSFVLLKNDGLLPLDKNIKKLAVIGPNADSGRNLLGDYSYAAMLELMLFQGQNPSLAGPLDEAHISEHGVKIPTILEALKAKLPQAEINYSKGCDTLGDDTTGFADAVNNAREADAVLLVLGDRSGLTPPCSVGETRDSVDLRLSGVQEELARAIIATGKPVVVVLVTGRPLAINFLANNSSAILEAWLPGEEGGAAIVDVLFGDANPAGRLPMTFPRHVGQVPIFYNQKPSGGFSNWYKNYVTEENTPLYPFGYGLSYTTFSYSDFSLDKSSAKPGESVSISVNVSNTGKVAGDETVQLYVQDEYASIPRPVKELKGFARITLAPGETRKVTFHLPVDQLAFYDDNLDLIVESGSIKVMVGASSTDIKASGNFEIVGAKKTNIYERVFTSPVEVQ